MCVAEKNNVDATNTLKNEIVLFFSSQRYAAFYFQTHHSSFHRPQLHRYKTRAIRVNSVWDHVRAAGLSYCGAEKDKNDFVFW